MPDPVGARQLPLVLPHEAALGRDDFLIGGSNRDAFALVDGWPDWPSPVVVLAGPIGSGKTHLVEIWRAISGAAIVDAGDLGSVDVAALAAQGAVAVEDAHLGFDETALFHLLNAARQSGTSVLITSRTWPQAWQLSLPDLASRLRAATPLEILEPDDDLLRRVLVKLFSDRQIMVEPSVVDFLVTRMERSLFAAGRAVDSLDRKSLAEGRRITRPLAARCLESADPQAE
ncbi:hypothetical protein H2509_06070 [Stappia sp. F7233]|uniref:Hda lid domain-containing protein n=1 Tax=Stappia albiluteola TaxID=2758565 RepID=A0A839AB94_9HYPH|nr:hypothetical protein [Stappia albiluteola]MBA5776691.1 hypothetical protein [Stappia albiluteola]